MHALARNSCTRTLTDAPVRLAKVRQVSDPLTRTRRSDAQDNRRRILDAARAAFAADGLKVPMREIARRAEVGPATLYRHFPTKEALAVEAFRDQFHACHAIVEEALADPEPWRGFRLLFERICELHARDRGFTAAFLSAYPAALDFAAEREYALASVATLIRRAGESGHLREDFSVDDLILMFTAHSGIEAKSTAVRLKASRRFATLAIRAFQADPAPSP